MIEKNNKKETLEAWADIVIERWQARINRLGVTDTETLLKSFKKNVETDAAGDPVKIVFTYAYYGKFPDMGVGKGVPLDTVGKKGIRQAKPWHGKVFFGQVRRLAEITAEKYGREAEINIIEELTNPQQDG